MIKPGWDQAPDWANWLAQDLLGSWCWFEFEPVALLRSGIFLGSRGRIRFSLRGWFNEAWEESLECRPKMWIKKEKR